MTLLKARVLVPLAMAAWAVPCWGATLHSLHVPARCQWSPSIPSASNLAPG